MALVSYEQGTKIYEYKKIYSTKEKILELINRSCNYYGSSLKGRIEATNYLLNIHYKSPIIVSEHSEIILFPISNLKDNNGIWFCYKYVDKYYNNDEQVIIKLKNHTEISVNVSEKIISNQILKSARLESILKSKKQ